MSSPCEHYGIVLDTSDLPEQPKDNDHHPSVGDVYLNQKGMFQLVIGVRRYTVYYITYDRDGAMHTCGQYGDHVFRGRPYVGRVENMPQLLDVAWFT